LPDWYSQWQKQDQPKGTELILVVGPEGGITPAELGAFQEQLNAAVVSIGPNVLRSSTAGPAAIAALSALTGRW